MRASLDDVTQSLPDWGQSTVEFVVLKPCQIDKSRFLKISKIHNNFFISIIQCKYVFPPNYDNKDAMQHTYCTVFSKVMKRTVNQQTSLC